MEEWFVLLNLSKCKRWIVLLHRVIAKKQSKREQIHPVCYMQQKRWRVLIQRMITKQHVKNKQIKRKQSCSLCFVDVLMCLHSRKQVQDQSE